MAHPNSRPKVERTCRNCGAVFFVHPCRSSALFCSVPCWKAVGRGPDTKPRKSRWDKREKNAGWRGGKRVNPHGYVEIIGFYRSGKHEAEHRVIAERVLGKLLPVGAEVHHVNTDKTDNRTCNLAILQDTREHLELHRKMRVRAAGGNPWRDRLCCSCGPRPASEFYRGVNGYSGECRRCSIRNATDRVDRKGRDKHNAERRRRYRLQVQRS